MSNAYINTLEYINDRIINLSMETQEKYFLEKFHIILKDIKLKLETYSDSNILVETYKCLVDEFSRVRSEGIKQSEEMLLYEVSSDLSVEIEKLNHKKMD